MKALDGSDAKRRVLDISGTVDPPAVVAADKDERLFAAVQEYTAAVEAGRRPSISELKARHPDIAEDLSACVQAMTFVNSEIARLDESADGFCKIDAGAGEDLAEGRPLGDFRLIREEGRGGMGIVYEAEQLSLGRHVALKILPLAAALDPRHLQRFRNEAQAAAHLHHTNIVPVYAVGCERGVHFYAMQLIDGHSLATVIGEPWAETSNQGPGDSRSQAARNSVHDSRSVSQLTSLRLARRSDFHRAAARLGLQAAEALEYAHQQGVVHRDIKPANLMLDFKGNLWVTDFGLAMMYLGDNGLTRPGDMLGTLRYMSPEQTSGRTVVLDHRTDVFSLGVTLYELMTFRRAFTSKTREALLSEVANVDPPPARTVDRSIPRELETILIKAMSKGPDERYQTAQEMADDLRRFLQDEPIHARPPTPWDKLVKWTRRHRALSLSAVSLLAVAAAGLTLSTILISREQMRTATALKRERQSAAEAHRLVGAFTRFAAADVPRDPRFIRVRRRMLETALTYNQSYLEARKDDPAAAAERADAEQWTAAAKAELTMLDEVVRIKYGSALLLEPAVAKELNLTPVQTETVKNLASAFLKTSPGGRLDVRSLSQEQRRDLALLAATQHWTAVQSLLSPDQFQRLLQISRQIRGVYAFTDPDVVAALAMTATQQATVQDAEAEFVERELGAPAEYPASIEASQKQEGVERVLADLTSQQRQIWQSLTGAVYSGPVPRFSQGVWRLE